MQDDYCLIDDIRQITITDDVQHRGVMTVKQGKNYVRIHPNKLDLFIDSMVLMRNATLVGKPAR